MDRDYASYDDVPYHSRWRHFEAGGLNRTKRLKTAWDGGEKCDDLGEKIIRISLALFLHGSLCPRIYAHLSCPLVMHRGRTPLCTSPSPSLSVVLIHPLHTHGVQASCASQVPSAVQTCPRSPLSLNIHFSHRDPFFFSSRKKAQRADQPRGNFHPLPTPTLPPFPSSFFSDKNSAPGVPSVDPSPLTPPLLSLSRKSSTAGRPGGNLRPPRRGSRGRLEVHGEEHGL